MTEERDFKMNNIKGFIFDMDGVLTDTELAWEVAYRKVCGDNGVTLTHEHKTAMIGMSTHEWATYLASHVGVNVQPAEIVDEVELQLLEIYNRELPLIPGSIDAVKRLSESFAIGIASSSTRKLIELTARRLGIDQLFTAMVSSEEVKHGKPHPDVYLETVRRLGLEPSECAAIEDSSNGIRSAHDAGLMTFGFPHADFPATVEALALCDRVLSSMDELTVDLVVTLDTRNSRR